MSDCKNSAMLIGNMLQIKGIEHQYVETMDLSHIYIVANLGGRKYRIDEAKHIFRLFNESTDIWD